MSLMSLPYDLVASLLEAILALIAAFFEILPPSIVGPFRYSFMQRALLSSVMVGAVCGTLSCYVVLKRWALLGDAISHAVLPGVALAYLTGVPFVIGAFLSGAATSVAIGAIERNTRIKEDSAMGIMFTAAFALGIVIISRIATSTHLMHILFGNVLGVRIPSLTATFVAGTITLVTVFLFHKEFVLYTFDPAHASAVGMNTRIIHYALMLLLTLSIVTALETVGVILVVAMLIIPGSTAYLIFNSLPRMMLFSAAIGVVSAVLGLYLSFRLNTASGGTIVLVAFTFFLMALIAGPNGVVRRSRAA